MASLSPLLSHYDQVILDLDGCVWRGDQAIDGSPAAIAALREADKRVAFATNNAWSSTEDYVAKLWSIGVRASLRDVVTVGDAVHHLLAETRPTATAFVIGSPALCAHVAAAGLSLLNRTELASQAQVVVVGGTDTVTYADLRDAGLAVWNGADLLGTARDPTLPMPAGPWPGTGAILAAVEITCGRRAQVVGKPAPALFQTVLDRLGEGRTLVVGDRLDSDIAGAAAAGLDGALVQTGDQQRHAPTLVDAGTPRPVATAASLADLVRDGA